jgi:hypothetical protein
LQDGTAWLLTWQEQRHGDAYIFSVVVHMTKKTCGYVFKYMMHIVVKGLDHWSGETSGTRMPTGISTAAGQQGQIGTYIFHLWSYLHETL